MLTLAEKGQIVMYVAPFLAFYIGMMWQQATHELEKERSEKQ